jgi:hypothetical protein
LEDREASTLTLRFRPTVWPGVPVPVPPVLRVHGVERDGHWLLPNLDLSRPTLLAELPPEVYLRQFRDTPADDLDALTELCRLGWIVLLHQPPYRDLPVKGDEVWKHSLADLEATLWPDQRHWYGDEAERDAVSRRHTSDADLGPPVHAAEVAWRVRAVQRVTNHLLAYLDGEPVAPAWRDCEDDLDAWRNFIQVTGAALSDFQVRVELEPIGQRQPPDETSLYSAVMLQLVNDLAANETVRTCANETCGRPFVRQLGRSAYGGHRRIGTRYCSNSCARAQYQREKRRRDRAAREAASIGPSGFREADEPKRREQGREPYTSAAGVRRRSR